MTKSEGRRQKAEGSGARLLLLPSAFFLLPSCRLHLIEPPLRPVGVVALGKLRDHALEVESRFRFSSQSRQRRAHVVENGIALAIVRIGVDDVIQALDRRGVAAPLNVKARDDVLMFRETIQRVLQPLIRFGTQGAVREGRSEEHTSEL